MRLFFGGDAAPAAKRWLWTLAWVGLAITMARPAAATLATSGDVSPVVNPVGGNVTGPLRVGNTALGSLTISNGPGINVSAPGVLVGDGAAGIGLITLAGVGSNLVTANDLTIGNNGAGSVAAGTSASITIADDLIMGANAGSSGDLFVDELGTVVTVTDAVFVGQAGAALIQVTDGGRLFADDTVIGQSIGGDGRIVVSAHGSLWRQDNSLTIGEAGRGDLQVLTQGRVETLNVIMANTATGVGLALVNGTGSLWNVEGFMNVGVQGNATVRVIDGGRIATNLAVRMATLAGSEAHATVSGLQSQWTIGTTMTVGEFGYGTVDVLTGGRITSGAVKIGDNVGSRGAVAVNGQDATWNIAGTLDVSEPGEGKLTIANGGLVTTTGVVRIAAAGQLLIGGGRLDIAAAGGLTNSGLIEGGGQINGVVSNTAAAKIRVRNGSQLKLGATLANLGTVEVIGGELEVAGATTNSLDIDSRDATLRFGGGLTNTAVGQLAITGGIVDVFGNVTNAAGGQIVVGAEGHGVFHDQVTNNGQLFVMPGANVLALENLTLSGSALMALQLGSEEMGEDGAQVEVGGQAALAGNLQVNLASGFAPQLGDSFQVVSAARGVSGTFATTALPALESGLSWEVEYSTTAVTLNVVPGFGADFNGDGFVNGADFAIFKGGFGAVGTADRSDGDANDDSNVDGLDFLAWQQQFGAGPDTATAAGAQVPEPAAGLLLALGVAALCMQRRTGR